MNRRRLLLHIDIQPWQRFTTVGHKGPQACDHTRRSVTGLSRLFSTSIRVMLLLRSSATCIPSLRRSLSTLTDIEVRLHKNHNPLSNPSLALQTQIYADNNPKTVTRIFYPQVWTHLCQFIPRRSITQCSSFSDRSYADHPLGSRIRVGRTSNTTVLVVVFDIHLLTLYTFLDGPLSLEPSSTVLHYAQTIFEGLKAYRHESGRVTLFRPDMNMKRMLTSANRLALPVCTFLYSSLLTRPTYNQLDFQRRSTTRIN